jgi:NAD(P)-dependent dehydrogenase (short-subunit alcohol dehydrogenase family)
MEGTMRSWFITGAGRGFGASIAARALSAGDYVVATARYPSHVTAALGKHKRLLVLPLDVTQEAQARGVARAALERVERIDVVVNNAGYGLLGAIEEASAEEVERVFRTNVFGLLNVTRALLPQLRKQGSGYIVNMSSLGGYRAAAGWGFYGATKLAIEAISEALSKEGEPLGIFTTVIDPGYFRSDFLSAVSLVPTARRIDDYDEVAGPMGLFAPGAGDPLPPDPDEVVDAVLSLVDSPKPPRRLRLGSEEVRRFESHPESVTRELEPWRSLVLSTDVGGLGHCGSPCR